MTFPLRLLFALFACIGALSGTASAFQSPPTPFCFGDGTGSVCPCSNWGGAGHGCANSVNPLGCELVASGTSSVSADTLTLSGSGMPVNWAVYMQGTSQTGVPYGDGLRCVSGTIIRLGTKYNWGGASQYPVGTDPSISVRGLNTVGSVRNHQCFYRNSAQFCTPSTWNLTNGLQVTWSA